VVIRDLDFVGISSLPPETKAILLVDPDAVLASPAAAQPFKTIPWRNREFEEIPHAVYLIKFPPGNLPQLTRANPPGCGSVDAIKDVLATSVPERAYHGLHYNGTRYWFQRLFDERPTSAAHSRPHGIQRPSGAAACWAAHP
jgi:hypothetical protein